MSSSAETIPSPSPLEYAPPTKERPPLALFYIAVVCWAAPLGVGIATLLLYALTSARSLPTIGFLTLLAGGGLMITGLLCISFFAGSLGKCPTDVQEFWTRRWKRVGFLLVLNVPISIGCASAGIWLTGRYTVIVMNSTATPLQNVTISGVGAEHTFVTIPPGQTVRHSFSQRGEGDIDCSATQNGTLVTSSAGLYLSGSDAGTTTFQFTPSGVNVKNK